MFFKKKKSFKESMEETRQNMMSFLHDMYYEIEAQRQIAIKTGLFTNEEFAEFMEDSLNEASVFYDDMDPEEILDERIKNKMGNADNVHVIKVEL